MYTVEFHFSSEREGAVPASVVLESAFRRNGEQESLRIEHLRVNCGSRDAQVVAFVTAENEAAVRRFGKIVGARVAADLGNVRFRRFRVWQ